MKSNNFRSANNFSKAGKTSAKIYSFIIDRDEKINELLKDKKYKSFIDKNYLDIEDKEIFEDSKNFIYEDIFDENYEDHYNQMLGIQKRKYFKHIQLSCAINKKINKDINRENTNIEKDNKLINSNAYKKKKYIIIENNPNKDYIYKKVIYSQSFEKMLGRDDLEKKKQNIEKKLKSLNKKKIKIQKDNGKSKLDLVIKELIELPENEKEKEESDKKDSFKNLDMNRMLERGAMPRHHDVRLRTTKAIDIKKRNPNIYKKLSLFSSNDDKNKFGLRKNYRFFSSLNSLHKNNSLINDNIKLSNEKLKLNPKTIFSSLNNKKEKNTKDISFSSNIFIKKSPKKELLTIAEFKKRKRTVSSKEINHHKNNIFHEKNNSFTLNSKNRTNINFHDNKSRNKNQILTSQKVQNSHKKGLSFDNMLSRDYVNRIQINDKIGAGLPLTPNYSTIYPKVINNVKYSIKHIFKKRKDLRDIGINIEENKNEDVNKFVNFSKMTGRGDMNSQYPVFMNNINSRNAFNTLTAKSLKMSHFSKRRLNNPISSFNNKKSFNSNLDNINSKIIHDSIDNIKEIREKEIRIKNYKNNIQNIFKKIIYDDIIDKNEINEDVFDFKKNPNLMKQINSSYKNLFSDYYKMNLDYLEKNYSKKKIDGITFKEIKSKNKIN